MKRIFLTAFLCFGAWARGADAAFDILLSQRKDDNSGPIQRNVGPIASSIWGFDANKHPVPIALGTGMALTGSPLTLTLTGSGSGTVTSVGLSLPNIFTVSGTPVTGSGTLTAALATQAANKIFAGPSTGADATPAFRLLVAADIPDLSGVYQPLDSDLTALAALASTGIVARTGSGTASTRTIAGTANRLTVTNGDGVSGNPTLDISASYVGQSSITTLGTIGTGVWNGTAIANANLANSAVTIGTTAISLGSSSTTLAGLTAVTVGDTFTLAPATLATGFLSYTGTLDATNSTTAGFKLASGLAVAKALFTGGNGTIGGNLTVSGTGTSAFAGPLTLVGNLTSSASAASSLTLSNAVASASGPTVALQKARGSVGAEADAANGDSIGTIIGRAYSGSYLSTAELDMIVDGTFTSAQRPPSRFDFYTNAANTAQTLAMRLDSTQSLLVKGTAASTSTTTGAFQVVGGAGIGGAIYAGGSLGLSGRTQTTLSSGAANAIDITDSIQNQPTLRLFDGATQTARLETATGDVYLSSVAVGKALRFRSGNAVQALILDSNQLGIFQSTTDASSTSTGSLQTLGGLSVTKSAYIGSQLRLSSDYTGNNNVFGLYAANGTTLYGLVGVSSGSGTLSTSAAAQDMVVRSSAALRLTSGGATDRVVIASSDGAATFTSSTASSSTTTGAVIVTGGVGIGGALNAASATLGPITSSTFDANATGNTLKRYEYFQFNNPDQGDGTNATRVTTEGATYGHFTFSNSTAAASNYVLYRFRVPDDLDTAVDLAASFTFRLGGADTGKHRYVISMADVAASASADSPTFSNAINLDFAGDASGASGDMEQVAYTTLTTWKSSLTAGHIIVVKVARDGSDGTNDTSTVNSTDQNLTIRCGSSQ